MSVTKREVDSRLTLDSLHSDPKQQAEKLQNGLASLVMNLVETIIEVLERQAFRRFNAGTLTDEEIERLGVAFTQMRERMSEMASKFDYQPRALELALSAPDTNRAHDQQAQGTSLVDLIDKVIDKQAVIAGDLRIAVAGIDLVTLNLLASVRSSLDSPSDPDDAGEPKAIGK